MAVIFVLSAQPKLPSPPSPFWSDILEKGGHALEYAVLAGLIWLGLGRRWPVLAWGLAVAYGISDEFHQSFVPGRHPDPMDVLFDATGAALAALLLWWGRSRRRGSPQAGRHDGAR
jgi:VanZ family protein